MGNVTYNIYKQITDKQKTIPELKQFTILELKQLTNGIVECDDEDSPNRNEYSIFNSIYGNTGIRSVQFNKISSKYITKYFHVIHSIEPILNDIPPYSLNILDDYFLFDIFSNINTMNTKILYSIIKEYYSINSLPFIFRVSTNTIQKEFNQEQLSKLILPLCAFPNYLPITIDYNVVCQQDKIRKTYFFNHEMTYKYKGILNIDYINNLIINSAWKTDLGNIYSMSRNIVSE